MSRNQLTEPMIWLLTALAKDPKYLTVGWQGPLEPTMIRNRFTDCEYRYYGLTALTVKALVRRRLLDSTGGPSTGHPVLPVSGCWWRINEDGIKAARG